MRLKIINPRIINFLFKNADKIIYLLFEGELCYGKIRKKRRSIPIAFSVVPKFVIKLAKIINEGDLVDFRKFKRVSCASSAFIKLVQSRKRSILYVAYIYDCRNTEKTISMIYVLKNNEKIGKFFSEVTRQKCF